MSNLWKNGIGLLAIALAIGLVLSLSAERSAGQKETGKNLTVVATDGTHLVVTDNQAHKVYFYAIEQGGKPGDELKLRGTINLEDVGKPIIKPTTIK
jgi:hypothetical protein